MLSLATMPPPARRAIAYLLADIDETLTWRGRLPVAAYRALARAEAEGLAVILVTGRPAGWGDLIIRQWPVAAVIAENGGLAFLRRGRAVERLYWKEESERAADLARLAAIGAHACREVAGARVSGDQPFRQVDFAIDHGEEAGPLSEPAIARLIEIFEAAGARAQASSIHVNCWFGDFDKLAMARRVLREGFGCDLEREQPRIAYVGDAPNDAPAFAGIANSIGVANVRAALGRLSSPPRYVTEAPGGFGFAEIVDLFLRG